MIVLTPSGQFLTNGVLDPVLPKKLADSKIAYITTAGKKVRDTSYMEERLKKIKDMNRSYTEIDIAGKSEEEVRRLLNGHDVIYVEGGNTFYLLKSARECNFETIVRDLLDQGVTYIGASAGAQIACPSILMVGKRGISRFGNEGLTDFTAMNLVPFLIIVHYVPDTLMYLKGKSETITQDKIDMAKKTPKTIDFLRQKSQETGYPFRILSDQQALAIDGEKIYFLGEGKEVTL